MTRTPTLYGVWLSQADYSSGHAPTLEASIPRNDLITLTRSDNPGSGRQFFLAKQRPLAGESTVYWEPVAFFGAKGPSRAISKKQVRVYLNKRTTKLRQMSVTETPSVADPAPLDGEVVTEQAPAAPLEGEIVLTLSANVAKVLRDTFDLVAQGRTVSVKALPEEPTE